MNGYGIANWRPTEHRVWRGSYDETDQRAQVIMPIGGEQKATLAFIDAYLLALEKWANETKVAGRRHRLSQNAIAVARTLLRRCTDFTTGRCTPCIATIMEKTRLAKPTVIALLARLREFGLLDWVRRTVRTGNAPGEGPPVRQTSNAYFIDLARLPKQITLFLKQRLRGILDLDAAPRFKGSPPLPPFPERMLQKLTRKAFAGSTSERRAERARATLAQRLAATSDPAARAQLMWPGDQAAQREFVAAQEGRQRRQSASSKTSPECPPKNRYRKE